MFKMFIYIITIFSHNKPIKYNQRHGQSHLKQIKTENYDLDEVGGKAGFNMLFVTVACSSLVFKAKLNKAGLLLKAGAHVYSQGEYEK